MTKNVYFDTNVFDHLHKRLGFSDGDLSALKASKAEGHVSFLLSVPLIEEIFCAIKADPVLTIRELFLIFELGDWTKVLKPSDLLVSEAIAAYANGTPRSSPFLAADHPVVNGLRILANPTQRDIDELVPMIEESRAHREEFREGMRTAREQVLKVAKKLRGQKPSFMDCWTRLAEPFAEGYAGRAGQLDACKARSIAGLLELRSLRMAVGVNLSLIYAETFEGRAPEMGDSRDQQHAVLASTADVFVTQDGKLANLLSRIPIMGLEITDLRSFLDSLRASSSDREGRTS